MDLATASSGSETRRAGASAGAVSVLAGPREALLLSAQGEAGKRTAGTSEDGLIRGLTLTAPESGRVASARAMVAGAGPRNRGGFYTQRAEGGTVADTGTRGEAVSMPARTGVAGRANPKLFFGTREGRLQLKQLI